MKEKNTTTRKGKVLLASLAGILIILLASGVLADTIHFFCLNRGEKIEYSKCNSGMHDKTCNSEHCNNICVNEISTGVYCPTDPSKCNNLPCLGLGDDGTTDTKPPIIALNNPKDEGIYNKRAILFDVQLNELSDISYTDLLNGKGKWTQLCNGCNSYSKQRSFNEGVNKIEIKAKDIAGNAAYRNVSFLVDSKKPQILKAEPTSGFANGDFLIQYTEDHLAQVRIDYGNTAVGMRSAVLSGCDSGSKKECSISLDLKDYDGQQIQYWFTVKDMALNNATSRKTKLTVDVTFPVITNLGSFFKQGTGRDSKYVLVNMSITEKNLDSVEYKDALDLKSTWKTLCVSLRKGTCDKKILMKTGQHQLDFQVIDEAGNIAYAGTPTFTTA